jgi:hypothetical protein
MINVVAIINVITFLAHSKHNHVKTKIKAENELIYMQIISVLIMPATLAGKRTVLIKIS